MVPAFLIEDDAFADDTGPFIEAVKWQGFRHKIVTRMAYTIDDFTQLFASDDCVIFYGSLGGAKQVARLATWIPGAYYDAPKYNCLSYYPVFGKYLLQENYIMLPYGDMLRQKEFLYDALSEDRALFIRPDRGDKLFTGQVVYKERYEEDIGVFGFGAMKPNELIVVATPRNIDCEWRFVVVDGEVIAGSQYKVNGRVGSDAEYPVAALFFAQDMAKLYQPEPIYVIDIGLLHNGHYKVVEVGCFSCAGFYAADRHVIVQAVSKIALREWEEYH